MIQITLPLKGNFYTRRYAGGFQILEHANPDLLDKLYEDVKRKD